MRLPVYTHHKIPPRSSVKIHAGGRRWPPARERLLPFFADVLPTYAAAFGSTWAFLLIADCIARATS